MRMCKSGLFLPVACGLLMAIGGSARAQPPAVTEPAFAAPVTVYAGTREYVWTIYVPSLTTERVEVITRVLAPTVRSRRWDYALPSLKSERYKLGQVAQWTCKYMDWRLPNACRTVWRDVYADLPVLTMQRDHVDFDVAEWAWEARTIRVDIPRWSWTETTLVIGVPAFGPEDLQRAQATLDARQAAAVKTIDAGIVTLDTGIAAVETQGADPGRLTAADGTLVDLSAVRQALRDEKAQQLERFARVRGELRNLSAAARGGTEAQTSSQ
jgi:hypothetical protein